MFLFIGYIWSFIMVWKVYVCVLLVITFNVTRLIFRSISFIYQEHLLGRLDGSVGYASAFSSGRDLRVLGSSPTSDSLLSREPASSSLSLPASLHTCDLYLSNKWIKSLKKKKKEPSTSSRSGQQTKHSLQITGENGYKVYKTYIGSN